LFSLTSSLLYNLNITYLNIENVVNIYDKLNIDEYINFMKNTNFIANKFANKKMLIYSFDWVLLLRLNNNNLNNKLIKFYYVLTVLYFVGDDFRKKHLLNIKSSNDSNTVNDYTLENLIDDLNLVASILNIDFIIVERIKNYTTKWWVMINLENDIYNIQINTAEYFGIRMWGLGLNPFIYLSDIILQSSGFINNDLDHDLDLVECTKLNVLINDILSYEKELLDNEKMNYFILYNVNDNNFNNIKEYILKKINDLNILSNIVHQRCMLINYSHIATGLRYKINKANI
jgi:hypothetical protein